MTQLIFLIILMTFGPMISATWAPTMSFQMWGLNLNCILQNQYGSYKCTNQNGQTSTIQQPSPTKSNPTPAPKPKPAPKPAPAPKPKPAPKPTPKSIPAPAPKPKPKPWSATAAPKPTGGSTSSGGGTAPSGQLKCVTYSPYKGSPGFSTCPTPAQLKKDMDTLLGVTKCVRFYSTDCIDVIYAWLDKSVENSQVSVGLGAWITGDTGRNEKEISTAVGIVKKYQGRAKINHLSIGDETLYRGDIDVGTLVGYIKSAKAQISGSGVLIAYQDNAYEMLHRDWFPSVCDCVDLILPNTFAYYLKPYNNEPVTDLQGFAKDAAKFTFDYINQVAARCPRKKTCAGEVMWPTSAPNQLYPNKANLQISRAFFCAWKSYAEQHNACYHWHEAFDGTWRVEYGDWSYLQNLGIYNQQCILKYAGWC